MDPILVATVSQAIDQVADLLGAKPEEILIGGTRDSRVVAVLVRGERILLRDDGKIRRMSAWQ